MKSLLWSIEECFTDIRRYLDKKHATLNDRVYETRYSKFESKLWSAYTNIWFFMATGEPDFHDFYDRLSVRVNDRPIGWGEGGFIPDKMGDIIWNEFGKKRLAKVRKLYAEAKKLEDDYLKNRSYDPKKRSKRVKKRPTKES